MAPKDCDKIVSGIAGQSTGNTQRKAVFGVATVLLLVIYLSVYAVTTRLYQRVVASGQPTDGDVVR